MDGASRNLSDTVVLALALGVGLVGDWVAIVALPHVDDRLALHHHLGLWLEIGILGWGCAESLAASAHGDRRR